MDSIEAEEKLSKALQKILPSNTNIPPTPPKNIYFSIVKNLLHYLIIIMIIVFFSSRTSTNGGIIGIGSQIIINSAAK